MRFGTDKEEKTIVIGDATGSLRVIAVEKVQQVQANDIRSVLARIGLQRKPTPKEIMEASERVFS
jgi:hypothetical protein